MVTKVWISFQNSFDLFIISKQIATLFNTNTQMSYLQCCVQKQVFILKCGFTVRWNCVHWTYVEIVYIDLLLEIECLYIMIMKILKHYEHIPIHLFVLPIVIEISILYFNYLVKITLEAINCTRITSRYSSWLYSRSTKFD